MTKIRDSNNAILNIMIFLWWPKKYITIDKIRKLGVKKSNTIAYIVYDRYYDDVLGCIV
jgi:hypothetical protein